METKANLPMPFALLRFTPTSPPLPFFEIKLLGKNLQHPPLPFPIARAIKESNQKTPGKKRSIPAVFFLKPSHLFEAGPWVLSHKLPCPSWFREYAGLKVK